MQEKKWKMASRDPRPCSRCEEPLPADVHPNRRICDDCQGPNSREALRRHRQKQRAMEGSVRIHIHELLRLAECQITLARNVAKAGEALNEIRERPVRPETQEAIRRLAEVRAANRELADLFLALAHRSGRDIGRTPITMEEDHDWDCVICQTARP